MNTSSSFHRPVTTMLLRFCCLLPAVMATEQFPGLRATPAPGEIRPRGVAAARRAAKARRRAGR